MLVESISNTVTFLFSNLFADTMMLTATVLILFYNFYVSFSVIGFKT